MTNEGCIAFCSSRGFSIAGTEYAGECFCGNELTSLQLDESKCDMACKGNSSQKCGGPAALSVYKKATGPTKRSTSFMTRHLNHLAKHGRRSAAHAL